MNSRAHGTLQATSVLLTPLGGGCYRLVFQDARHYAAVEAGAALLEQLAGKALDAAGAPAPGAARVRGYAPVHGARLRACRRPRVSDVSRVLAHLARNFPQWEIIRDRDGWHAIPSARLVFHQYLQGREVPELHRETAAGLLVLPEAWKDTAS